MRKLLESWFWVVGFYRITMPQTMPGLDKTRNGTV